MIPRLLLIFALLLSSPAVAAPSHGVIDSRTNLPRTLPLQVKTAPDRDAYLVLRDAQTDAIVLTAYAEAGRPFRALMPPGDYTFHAALGTGWEGPEALFGDNTRLYDHPLALSFSAGYARKSGNLIDLSAIYDKAVAVRRGYAICQFYTPRPNDAPRNPIDSPDETSIAPEITAGPVAPPGPYDPLLDGAPELGQEFGNTVSDVPLARRASEPNLPGPATLPDRDIDRDRLRARICD
ncbi:hypothetical protein PARPLA_00951 [Rhodobacteraceae bacterium THAF1]|uniref:hypothetical protein n=1 Tax=Palleronia sp. THAF1 TaxID=2587842 RepID=UPI000F413037|nr:hypothetical protein [Palleronia sp. THAF1]QFU07487.1 hypothetical protein FIU81_02230 [Palleronia sp. THAF1]VDC20432.1 hypothetical protein PARPLA_00951 [Rhodobacteraceae bacterium THAF1]